MFFDVYMNNDDNVNSLVAFAISVYVYGKTIVGPNFPATAYCNTLTSLRGNSYWMQQYHL